MHHVRPINANAFRNTVMLNPGVEPYMDEDFDQDTLSGRYGNARDRHVPCKLRESRTKPRQWMDSSHRR